MRAIYRETPEIDLLNSGGVDLEPSARVACAHGVDEDRPESQAAALLRRAARVRGSCAGPREERCDRVRPRCELERIRPVDVPAVPRHLRQVPPPARAPRAACAERLVRAPSAVRARSSSLERRGSPSVVSSERHSVGGLQLVEALET